MVSFDAAFLCDFVSLWFRFSVIAGADPERGLERALRGNGG